MSDSEEVTSQYTPEQIASFVKIAAGFAAAFFVFFIGAISDGSFPGTNPPTTQPTEPTTPTTQPPPNALDILDNPTGLVNYFDDELASREEISEGFENRTYGAFHNDKYSESTSKPANSAHPQGQFRIICQTSHYAYDDPIIFPEQAGASHLHRFFGNTAVNSNTITADLLENEGGSSCQFGALNRSAYWMPAMLDGEGVNRKIVIPKIDTLYYKSYKPADVELFPVGTQMLAGNLNDDGSVNTDGFRAGEWLHWGCYNPSAGQTGIGAPLSNTIPGSDHNGDGVADTPECPNGWDIQSTIQFPQCHAVDSNGNPILTDEDFQSHNHILYNFSGNYGIQNEDCPSSHPYRTPQISYLTRYANPGPGGTLNWHLSSDLDHMSGERIADPGSTLHGDWFGAWDLQAQQSWLDGCFIFQSMNCTLGQTGINGTNLKAKPLIGSLLENMFYNGPYIVDDPSS